MIILLNHELWFKNENEDVRMKKLVKSLQDISFGTDKKCPKVL